MKVILIKAVKSLGKQGDVVNVSDGYARNFLFPQNLAVCATESSIQKMKQKEIVEKNRAKKQMKAAGKMAQALDGYELIIKGKVSERNTLYASVNSKTIVLELKKNGFDLEEEMIMLEDPIKEPCEKDVVIELQHGFEATIKLIIENN
ncbi:MAG: 50S ribosomal protein L9 [Patescibacteria group bacterium]